MIRFIKPKFWDNKIGFISALLLPLTFIFNALLFLRKQITTAKNFKIKVICVGNIYLGGTGKTPLTIFLAKELSKLGKKPVIIRKYYKNHKDEYGLIKNYFKKLIVCKNRIDGLNKAIRSGFDVAILDDGFQDYKIKKDLNIICFNSNQLIGNGLILPSGPLRENLSSLKRANIIIINGKKNKDFEKKILRINKNLKIFYSFYKPVNLNKFRNKKLLALAGIGNPENFFQLINKNNLHIKKKIILPDHYRFSKNEMQNIITDAGQKNYKIIMTEKDYFKISNLKSKKINYVKVNLKINGQRRLLNRIDELYL